MRMMEPLQSATRLMPVPGDVTFVGINSDTLCGPGDSAQGAPRTPATAPPPTSAPPPM